MFITLLFVVLSILILTTVYVVVRTIVFQWSQRSVEQIEGIPVDDQQVAEHGIDERIPVEAMGKMVKFYAQLMQVWGTREMTIS